MVAGVHRAELRHRRSTVTTVMPVTSVMIVTVSCRLRIGYLWHGDVTFIDDEEPVRRHVVEERRRGLACPTARDCRTVGMRAVA